MSVSGSLLLMLACRIIEPPPAFQPVATTPEPPPITPTPAPVPSTRLMRIKSAQALLWATEELKHNTVALLRQGQLVLAGKKGEAIIWHGQQSQLVAIEAYGASGWMVEADLSEVVLPTWATAVAGAFDPFENPTGRCQETAPSPWAGGEFRLLEQTSADRVRYEVGCLNTEESVEGIKLEKGTISKMTGEASLLVFAEIQHTRTCSRRLEATGSVSEALKAAWPQDPVLCSLLSVEQVYPPFPGTAATWKIDLPGGSHPAEGFVANGAWLATSLTGGTRIFDGPDYTLWTTEEKNRFKVLRFSLYPPSVIEVLDKPMTGEEAEAFAAGAFGALQGSGGSSCVWLPGRKQYYICR